MTYQKTYAERRAEAIAAKERREQRYAAVKQAAAYKQYQRLYEEQQKREEEERRRQEEIESAGVLERNWQSALDFGANVVTGFVKGLEGIVDFGATVVGSVGGLIDDGFQDGVKDWVARDLVGEWFGNAWQEKLDKSYLNDMRGGDVVEGVASGIGQMLPAVIISVATGGAGAPAAVSQALSLAELGVSAAGTSTEEAFKEGADYGEGMLYGTLSGGVEVGTELMWGGFGKLYGKGLLDNVGKSVAKTGVARIAKEALEEGAEEVASELAQPFLKTIYKGSDALKDFGDADYWKGVGKAGIVGAGTSVVYGGTIGHALTRAKGQNLDVDAVLENVEKIDGVREKQFEKGTLTADKVNEQNKTKLTDYEKLEKVLKKKSADTRDRLMKNYGLETLFEADGSLKTDVRETLNKPVEKVNQSLSLGLQGQEERIGEILSKEGTKIYEGELTAEEQKQYERFKSKFAEVAEKMGGAVEFVLTDTMDADNGLFFDNVVALGKDQLSSPEKWSKTLVHELTHFPEGSRAYAEFANFLIKDLDADTTRQLLEETAEKYGIDKSEIEGIEEAFDKDALSEDQMTLISEAIANRAEQILGTEKMIKLLARKKPGLARRLLERFSNFIKALGQSEETRAAEKYAKELLAKYENALQEMGLAYNLAEAESEKENGEESEEESGEEGGENTASEELPPKHSYKSIATSIADFVKSVLGMKDKTKLSKRKLKLGDVSERHIQLVESALGKEGISIDLSDYTVWINGGGVQHIDVRHGEKGKADSSMASPEDVSKVFWMVNNADSAEIARNNDGTIDYAKGFLNADGSHAVKMLMKYQNSDGTYTVTECVPDSAAKQIYIISAYKNGGKGQLLNMEQISLQPTSKTPNDSDTTKNSISQNQEKSTPETKKVQHSKKSTALADEKNPSEGQVRRAIADHTRERIYSEQDTRDILLATVGALGKPDPYVEYAAELRGKTFDQFALNVAKILNTMDQNDRIGLALEVADFIMEHAAVKDVLNDPKLNEAKRIYEALKVYKNKIDLKAIKKDVKAIVENDNSIFNRWGTRKGAEGIRVSDFVKHLEEKGIHFKGESDAEILVEFDDMFREARKKIQIETEKRFKTLLDDGEFHDQRQIVAKKFLEELENGGKPTSFSKFNDKKFWANAYREQQARKRRTTRERAESRRKTEARNGLLKLKEDIANRVIEPKNSKYVPRAVQSAVVDILDLIVSDNVEAAKIESRLEKLYDEIENTYDPFELDSLAAQIEEQQAQLAFIRNGGRSAAMKEAVGRRESLKAKIDALAAEYKAMKGQGDLAYNYEEELHDMLISLHSIIGDTDVADMDVYQLEATFSTLKRLDHTIKNAVEFIGEEESRNIIEIGNDAIKETREGGKAKIGVLEKYIDLMLRPSEFFEKLGGYKKGSTWKMLGDMLEKGGLRKMALEAKYRALFEELVKDPQYKKQGDLHKLVDIGLKDENGKPIMITRGMMLDVYMNTLNEENFRHMNGGGLRVADLEKYYKRDVDAYNRSGILSEGEAQEIVKNRNDAEELQKKETETLKKLRQATEKHYRPDVDRYTKELQDVRRGIDQLDARFDELRKSEVMRRKALQAKIEGMMTEFEKKAVKVAEEFSKISGEDLNAVTELAYGYSKARVKNYWHIHVDSDFLNASFETLMRNFKTENAGFMKSRVNSANPIYLEDFWAKIEQQIVNTAQYAGMLIPLRNFEKIYNIKNPGWTDSLQRAVGETYMQVAKDYIEDLITDLNGGKPKKNTIFAKLRSNVAGSALILNPSVTIGQAASYPAAAAVVGWKPLMKALARGGKSGLPISRADIDLINKWSPLMAVRSRGYVDADIGDIRDSSGVVGKLMNNPKARYVTKWIQATDMATVGRLWYAAEYYVQDHNAALEKGTDAYYKQVAEVFNRIVFETQPNYTTYQRPQILRSDNEIVRSLTMFMTQRLQNFNILYGATRRLIKYSADFKAGINNVTEADVKEARTAFVHAASSMLVSALVLVGMKNLVKFLLGKKDDWKDEEGNITFGSIALKFGDMFLDTILGTVVGGSELYELGKSIFGKDKYYGIDVNGVSIVGDFASSIVNLTNNTSAGNARKLIIKGAQLFGIPAQNLENLIMAPLRFFDTEAAYQYDAVFKNPSVKKDLQRALERGDDKRADTIIDIMIDRREADLDEASRKALRTLTKAGYSVLPRSVGNTVTYNGEEISLTKKQTERFRTVYNASSAAVEDLVKLQRFKDADGETQARAVKWIWDTYYNLALSEVVREGIENKNVLFAEAIDIEKLAMVAASAKSITADLDRKGNAVSGSRKRKIERYIEGLKLSAAQKYMLMGYLGYKNANGEKAVREYISRLRLTAEEKKLLLGYSGY